MGRAGLSRWGWLRSLCLSAVFFALIALPVEDVGAYLALVLLGSVVVLYLVFHLLFPGSLFFTFAFVNLTAVYACIFVFFVEAHFRAVDPLLLPIGFVAPLLAFLVGTLWRRRAIRRIVSARRLRDARHFAQVLIWLVPVIAVGAATFFIPDEDLGGRTLDIVFLGAMAAIALTVLLASRDVAAFLIDTGLLFEEFFERAAQLLIPAFAFLTFYSLVVIVFASVYALADRLSGVPHFRIAGAARTITFGESLYFSLTTLATVGYGDIAPAAGLARVLVGFEILCGILLLLFGFNEIIGYSRERAALPPERPGKPGATDRTRAEP